MKITTKEVEMIKNNPYSWETIEYLDNLVTLFLEDEIHPEDFQVFNGFNACIEYSTVSGQSRTITFELAEDLKRLRKRGSHLLSLNFEID